MGKLGKKARKFARKKLPSLMRKKRKHNSVVKNHIRKRKASSSFHRDTGASHSVETVLPIEHPKERDFEGIGNHTLEEIFADAFRDLDNGSLPDSDVESDEVLPEALNCPYVDEDVSDGDTGSSLEGTTTQNKNKAIYAELVKQEKKLENLKKDPKFCKFLESNKLETQREFTELISDEECERSSDDANEKLISHNEKVLSSSTIDSLCEAIMDKQDMSVLPVLLNGFRAACCYGDMNYNDSCRIRSGAAFGKILFFVFEEAHNFFNKLLGLSSCIRKRETIIKLQTTSKWNSAKPLVKSYFRSSLHLLDQATDTQMILFILSRLQTSMIFLVAFPALQRRLLKTAVRLWTTGDEAMSLNAFCIIRDAAPHLQSDCFSSLLKDVYLAFVAQCNFFEPKSLKRIQFLMDSCMELFLVDISKSYQRACGLLGKMARVLQWALTTKTKDSLMMIHNWQYIICLEFWVKYICAATPTYHLQALTHFSIQIIKGVAHLSPGPRYMPLRFRCIDMLNKLSQSSGMFVPLAYLCLGFLECCESIKLDPKPAEDFDLSSSLKVPKQLIRSKDYQLLCVQCAVITLSWHFSQWCYDIAFPDLALVPLICLKKFCEKSSDSLKHPVKQFVQHVEQNIEFIRKRRDQVSFSSTDKAPIEAFLQDEKRAGTTSFYQYYVAVTKKSPWTSGLTSC